MKTLEQIKNSFDFKYLQAIIDRPLNTPVNQFMEGQSECALRAMKVINELMIEVALLKTNYMQL